MNVYHLTEFVIGELPENNYINFAYFTSTGTILIIFFFIIACFLFFYFIIILNRFLKRK